MPKAVRQLARQGVGLAFKTAGLGLKVARSGLGWALHRVAGDGRDGAVRPQPATAPPPGPLGTPERGRGASPPHPAAEPGRRVTPPQPGRRTAEEASAQHTAGVTAAEAPGGGASQAEAPGGQAPAADGPKPEAADVADQPAERGRPSAAEAVAAELAQAPAWEPADIPGEPPDPLAEHVDEGETLAAESADSGAENGAGPEISVSAPWPGYDRMRARDIVDRLAAADADLAAAVTLYESSKKRRKTVLEAAERAGRR